MYHRLNDIKTGQESEEPRNKALNTVSTFYRFSRCAEESNYLGNSNNFACFSQQDLPT